MSVLDNCGIDDGSYAVYRLLCVAGLREREREKLWTYCMYYCSCERLCQPENLAHSFRYLREKNYKCLYFNFLDPSPLAHQCRRLQFWILIIYFSYLGKVV